MAPLSPQGPSGGVPGLASDKEVVSSKVAQETASERLAGLKLPFKAKAHVFHPVSSGPFNVVEQVLVLSIEGERALARHGNGRKQWYPLASINPLRRVRT